MPRRPPLDPAIAACRGISPTARDALIAEAATVALRFTGAVKARNAAEVQRLVAGKPREFLVALAVVLAEGIQPGSMTLALAARSAQEEAPKGEGANAA